MVPSFRPELDQRFNLIGQKWFSNQTFTELDVCKIATLVGEYGW